MTRLAAFGVVVLSTAVLLAQDATTYGDTVARDLFTRSRFAVGAAEVGQLISLTMRGTSRIAADGGTATAATEIRVLAPDCYLRIDRVGGEVRRTGMCGDTLLTSVIDDGHESRPPASMTQSLLRSERARFVRLLLGAATYVSPRYALVLRAHVMPNGRPDAFRYEALGQNTEFTATVQLDSATLLPTRIDALIGKKIASTSFADRREVSGLKLPFRMTSTLDDKPVDDLVLDEIVVNPALTKAQFVESGAKSRQP